MTEKEEFNTFLFRCALIVFASSVALSIINIFFLSNMSSTISSINSIAPENRTEILADLINWQGQGTISWGLGFLASITVFVAILIGLLTIPDDKLKDQNVKARINFFLHFIAWLFLFVSTYSIFELLRYYRIVATLQQLMPVEVPQGLLFCFITNYGGEVTMIILSAIFLCLLKFYPVNTKKPK